MQVMTAHLEATSPLLMNSAKSMSLERNEVKTSKRLSREDEAEASAYRNALGNLCFPTDAFRKSAISGGKGRKVGRTGLNTILMSALFPFDEMTDLLDPFTDGPLTDYEIDTRRAVIPATKGSVARTRPKVLAWTAYVRLEFDDEVTDELAILDVLTAAGKRVGIGNYRPEKGGPYGRFRVID